MKKKCVLICASPETDSHFIKQTIPANAFVVCIDGGYAFALNEDIKPDLIVGDFDSLSSIFQLPSCEIVSLPTHKDDTDTMYAVKICLQRGYNEFYIYGATGSREDHTFANLCVLKFLADRNCSACIEDSDIKIFCQNSGTKQYTNEYQYFSVFPFGCQKCILTLKGFEYPLDYGTLSCDYPMGISNSIIKDIGEVTVHEGCIIIMQTKEKQKNEL